MRIGDLYRLIVAILLVGAVSLSCGGEKQTDQSSGQTSDQAATGSDSLSLEKQIEKQVNLVMDRLRYDDKSALWENELEYLHETMNFDRYVNIGEVKWANADSVEWVEVRKATEFEDSLVCDVGVHFAHKDGRKSVISDEITLYRSEGRWVKPTISRWVEQAAFDSVRQEAIRAAEAEAGR